jgi:hypothetical protein
MKIGGFIKPALEKVSKNSPTILTVLGVAGVVMTVVCAIKDTNKVQDKLEELAEESENGDIFVVDYVKAVAPHYIPTMISAAATITCIVGSNVAASHQRAALTSELLAANTIIREYSNTVREIAPDVDKDVKQKVAKSHIDNQDLPDGEIIFEESITGYKFTSTAKAVRDAEYEINRMLSLKGYVALNDFFRLLDIPQIPKADDIGWCDTAQLYRGYKWIDFQHPKKTGLKQTVYRIVYPFEPHIGYMDDDITYFGDETVPFNEES